MKLKKSAFSLIEVLIALALTSLILVSVMSIFRQVSQMSRISEGLQQENFRLRYLENRLSQIFPRAVSATAKQKDFYFFTSQNPPGLVLSYDNGVSKQKEFSNHVLGRFFLDPQTRRFYLATWPSPQRWLPNLPPPIKLEVLLEDVQELSWDFFVPPDKGWKPQLAGGDSAPEPKKDEGKGDKKEKGDNGKAQKTEKGEQPAQKPPVDGAWIGDWKQEYKLLPGLVRLKIVSRDRAHQFIFPLSQTERQIVYTQ